MNVDISSYEFRDVTVTTPLTEYLQRPDILHWSCWYDYIENYVTVKKSLIKNDDFYILHQNHPKRKSHVVVKRTNIDYKKIKRKPVIVQYHGFSLKCDVRRDTKEKKETFAMCALVMFKAYRSVAEIKSDHNTYYDALFDGNGDMRGGVLSTIGYEIIEHNEDRWTSKFASQISAKNHQKSIEKAAENIHVEYDNEDKMTKFDADDNMIFEETVLGDSEIYTQNYYDFISKDTYEDNINMEDVTNQHISYPKQTNELYFTQLHEKKIDDGYKAKLLIKNTRCAFLERLHYQEAFEVKKLIDAAIDSLSHKSGILLYNEIRQSHKVPEDEYVEYRISEEKGKVKFRICASLQEIVDVFEFSNDQKRAFVIGALHLLTNIVTEDDDDVNFLQIFGVVQGLAGSGKSYVINGWNVLGLSWGQQYAVQCVCVTCIAASNIQGRTIHSMFHVADEDAIRIKLLVIDEVFDIAMDPYLLVDWLLVNIVDWFQIGVYGFW